eukprot:scaffold3891_cov290-Chaetoceros_neogracile.AAC.3
MSTETANTPTETQPDEANVLKRPREEEVPGKDEASQQIEQQDVAPPASPPPPPLPPAGSAVAAVENSSTAPSCDDPPSPGKAISAKRSKNSNKGRHGDPRMHRAVASRLLNPELSLLEALLEGGFTFPEGTEGSGKSDRNIFDADGVLLCQRKNQLSRRLRLAKKRQQASRVDGNMFNNGGAQSQGDSRTLQNMLLNGQLPVAGNEMPMMPPHQYPPYYPAQQPGQIDPTAMNGPDGRGKRQGIDNNLDQYLQHTARSMGIRPEQLQQQLRQYPGQGMFPGFPPYYPGMPQQGQYNMPPPPLPPNNEQQQQNSNTGISAGGQPPNGQQNMPQMPPMMSMQQQQYNTDLSRMLLNRSLIMNVMEQQNQQPQVPGQRPQQKQEGEGAPVPVALSQGGDNEPAPVPEQQPPAPVEESEDFKV